MYIILNSLLQARATNAKRALVETFGVDSASAPQKSRLLLLKPLDRAVAKQMASAATSFGKTLVDLFPPQMEDFFARHRSFNHLRLQYDPANAATVDKLLDRAFWPDEATRKECAEALGADPLLAALFNEDLLVLCLEHYLPSPLTEVVDDLAATHAKEYRVSERHLTLLKAFTSTFSTFSSIRMTVIGDEQSIASIEVAHRNMLELFQLVEAEATEQRPSFITLDIDDERKLTAILDGKSLPLATSDSRTLVSLALLQSKEWFSVDDFSDLYFGERKGDTQKRFNTCITRVPMLKVNTGGKGQTGKRRVVGCIFSGVEGREPAFRAFLHEHYDEVTKKTLAPKSA